MRFLKRSLVGIFLISVTVALMAWAVQIVAGAVQTRMGEEPRQFTPPERVLTVNAQQIEIQTLTPELIVFGEVLSRRTLDLRTSVGGTVLAVSSSFQEGGQVDAGELLLQIDPIDAEAALARVRADMQDAEGEQRDAERAIVLALDELAAARNQADLRERALARQIDLKDRGVGTSAAIENAELAESSAAQAVLARRQSLAQAEARLDQAATRIARQQINLAEAQRNLAATEIHATFAGTLGAVSVIAGGRVTANELIAQIIDPDQLEVAFRVSTPQYTRLLDEQGDLQAAPVGVSLDVLGIDLLATGQISRESAGVGEGQTGRLLFATLENPRGFRPGDFVTVSVAEPELSGVFLLPATALGADGTLLIIGENDRLEAVDVQLLRRQGNDVILRGDTVNGRQVVSERSPLLGAGIRVQLADTNSQSERREPPTPSADAAMISLTDERRAKLVAFVEGNSRMPQEAKTRILGQLQEPEVPAEIVTRIESRMGG